MTTNLLASIARANTQLIKQAANPLAMFGDAVATAARKGGTAFTQSGWSRGLPGGFQFNKLTPMLDWFRGSPSPRITNRLKNLPKKFEGVAMNMSGIDDVVPGAKFKTVGQPMLPDEWNKLKEMQTFMRAARGDKELEAAIPRTRSLATLFRKAKNLDHAKELLSKQHGGQFVVKDVGGLQSGGIEDQITDSNFQDYIGDLFKKKKSWGNYLVQHRREMQQGTAPEKWMDSLAKQFYFGDNPWFDRSSREMRVHSVDGKVLRGTTLGRGVNALAALVPLNSSRARASEDLVEKLLAKVKNPKYQKASYGFDIGIGKDGKPFMIEANPTNPLGYSGIMQNPYYIDALTAAVEGRRSGFQNLKTTAKTVGGVGAAGAAGAVGLNYLPDQQQGRTGI